MVINNDNRVSFPGGKGQKPVKVPNKKELQAMCEKLIRDNHDFTDHLAKAGLTLCLVHGASKKIWSDMGGKIIHPAMEKHKKHIQEIIDATEGYKDWDKLAEDKEPDSTKGLK